MKGEGNKCVSVGGRMIENKRRKSVRGEGNKGVRKCSSEDDRGQEGGKGMREGGNECVSVKGRMIKNERWKRCEGRRKWVHEGVWE